MKPSRINAPAAMLALITASGLTLVGCSSTPSAVAAVPVTAPAVAAPAPASGTVATIGAVPPAGTTAAPSASTAKPRLICEDDAQTGSHFRKRICMSPEEAKERQKAARDMVHNMQMHSVQSCSDAGGCPPG